jgi:DNA-binding NarL/FixJ family response regulator
MKVLVIDDEKLDLFIASKLLQPDFEVTGFTSPREAIAWATSNPFDVAIIDYYLDNGVLGVHVLKDLRKNKNSFKAILLTNHLEEDQAKEMMAAGFNSIIYKPVSLEKVKDAMN